MRREFMNDFGEDMFALPGMTLEETLSYLEITVVKNLYLSYTKEEYESLGPIDRMMQRKMPDALQTWMYKIIKTRIYQIKKRYCL